MMPNTGTQHMHRQQYSTNLSFFERHTKDYQSHAGKGILNVEIAEGYTSSS